MIMKRMSVNFPKLIQCASIPFFIMSLMFCFIDLFLFPAMFLLVTF